MTPGQRQGSFAELYEPITRKEQDLLGYRYLAASMARVIAESPAERSLVIGLNGPWGSGKTSIINLTLEALREGGWSDSRIVRFDPWWFTASDNLTQAFLNEFAAKAGHRQPKLLKTIRKYGRTVAESELFEGWWVKLLKVLTREEKQSITEAKEQVEKALKRRKRRYLMVIDDIDRLSRHEMAKTLALVKTVASFPYVSYLLACDFDLVARGLSKIQGSDTGRAYLDKIIHIEETVPPARGGTLIEIFRARMETQIPPPPAPWGTFPVNSFENIEARFRPISTYVRTPRDLHKLMNSAAARYAAVQGEVCRLDFIMLETIRVFEPEVYAYLRQNERVDREGLSSRLQARHSDAAESIVGTLFGEESIAHRRQRRSESRASELRFRPIYFRLSHDPEQVTNAFLRGLLDSIGEDGTFYEKALGQWGETTPSTKEVTDLFRRLADFMDSTSIGDRRPLIRDMFRMSACAAREAVESTRNELLSAAAAMALFVLARGQPKAGAAYELASGMQDSNGIELAAWFVFVANGGAIFHDDDRDYDRQVVEILSIGRDAVQSAAGALFDAAAADGRLLRSRHLPQILRAWRVAGGDAPALAWIHGVTESDDESLLRFVDQFLQGAGFSPEMKGLLDFASACERIWRIARNPEQYSPGPEYTKIAERFRAEYPD